MPLPLRRPARLRRIDPFQLLLMVTLGYAGGFAAVRIALTYRALELGASAFTVGLFASLFSVLPMLFAVRSGRVVDRAGARLVLVAGMTTATAAGILAAIAPNLPLLMVANLALGLGQMWLVVGSQSLITELRAESEFTAAFAANGLTVALGQALGTPLIGLVLGGGMAASASGLGPDVGLGDVHTLPALWLCVGIFALVLPITLLLPQRQPKTGAEARSAVVTQKAQQQNDTTSRKHLTTWQLVMLPGMSAAMLSSLVVLAGIELFMAYLPLIGEAADMSPTTVSLLVALRPVASIVSRFGLPAMVERFNPAWLLVANPVMTTPCLILLAFTDEPWLMAVLLIVIGLWWGVAQPLTMTWVTRIAPAADRGTALSLRLTANRCGQVGVPFAAGAIAGALGPGSVFAVCGALSAFSLLAMLRSLREPLRKGWRREPESEAAAQH